MAFYRSGFSGRVSEMAEEGLGVAGGFIAGGVLGRQFENALVKVPVSATDSFGRKVWAASANNGPKLGAYWLMKRYDANTEGTRDAAKALLGSVVYDLLLRIANKGVNPASVELGGYRILGSGSGLSQAQIERLLKENGILRTELNKAMQKLAGVPARLAAGPNPDLPGGGGDFKYGGETSPAVQARQRRYGAMPWTPDVAERERRFGAMPFEQNPTKTSRERRYGFMEYPSNSDVSTSVFGMQ